MDITDLRKLLINDFGTPPDYMYHVVPSVGASNFVKLDDDKIMVRLLPHTVKIYEKTVCIDYGVFHNLKLVVFSSDAYYTETV